MSAPRRSTSLRDSFSDSERMEGTGSWDDALDWFKLEHPASSSVSHHANYKCLLEAERVLVEGRGVVLVNTDGAGTLLVTNFRLIFLSEGTENIIALGTIPLATIEKFSKMVVKNQSAPRHSERTPSQRFLQVIGKDMRIIVFGFRPKTKQRRAIYDGLLRCTKPSRLWDLYAFSCGPFKFTNANPKVRLLNEYFRLLGKGICRASMDMIDNGSYTMSNELWRICNVNSNYLMCPSYPFALIVPKSISDEEVIQASNFRSKGRLPIVSWCHPESGAVLARSSQPLVGLMMNMRSNTDEKLVAELCPQLGDEKKGQRKLYIADARPRKNALANVAMGGGSESSSNYLQSEVVFFGIDNIHAMRESLSRLRDYLDAHGTTSSDGTLSLLRHGGWTWGGGNLSNMSASVSTLGDSGWLIHVQSVLAGSAWIAARVALESASVLVHCSDGWDRTSQLVALANLLLDPYYRTFTGFQALIEKDWLAFGHPFAERGGMPTVSGSSDRSDLCRQSSVGSFSLPPMRPSSGSFSPPTPSSSHAQNQQSPIFLQWIDCVSQLLRMYPFAFEFSSAFLVDLLDCVLSCRFGNFFCNSEKERQQVGISEACGCLWAYLADLRSSEGRSHVHCNPFYSPLKHNGPLLPPAAALAPTLWPQFHLRWACPSEAQAGELEAQCRIMSIKFSKLQEAKEGAEKKAKETEIVVESLSAELRNEKQRSSSAMALAKRASMETAAIKRAIQSLGCKVHYASGGDTTVDIETSPVKISQKSVFSPFTRESVGIVQHEDKSDLSVSISVAADDVVSNNPFGRVCDTLCPLRTRDGGCRWPDAGCAQLASQFIGVKADYEALDSLSIYEGYFKTMEGGK
ncbi:phosphatidylinositol-3-phosphatase myotubularin-1 isoform X2 [Populus alba]|uniref:phosphatidylinositol-3,5-bisphosphate 3-phosphatase n=1 Tax=Populus alba TaxID=43335 RepID=A0A4U5PSF9_POPAL|nr:phosphatidylinositol-3-phosphatase myotubularin-1-like isoform X2 [Populus alba]TKR99880.1 phosphatidylinositol-3-phosphatase myotubularin-1-like isoform X2 [Populus alba]